MQTIKWAMLGTGYIANSFAEAMNTVKLDGTEQTAVCGTSLEKARIFGEKYGFASFYDNFDRMLEEARPDVVYIAVPNMLHYKFVMKALEKGVHVLCEKPIADNMGQLREMLNNAAAKNVFLMEGMWTRCFPAVRKVCEWLANGRIGKVKAVRADFGLKAVQGWQGWKASTTYSGGALRDVGIYTIAWAFLAYTGELPVKVDSVYRLKNGADFHSELLFRYTEGRSAYLTGSFDMVTDHTVSIYGETGVITAGPRLWCPQQARLFTFHTTEEFTREQVEFFEDKHPCSGMQYEITHVNECIRAGRIDSPYFSQQESVNIAQIIDSLRQEWGVRYPSDQ
jgi:predicted dehydrogenase